MGIVTVLHPPLGFLLTYIADVPGVGVFSRAKSAGLVSGCGVPFRLFHLLSPVICYICKLIPKNFYGIQPPVSIRFFSFPV